MNTSTGRVVSVHADSSGERALVEVDASVACPRCAEGKGCGAGLLGQGDRNRVVDAVVSGDFQVHEGDTVDVVLEPRNLLRAASIVYGMPLLSALLMAAVGWQLSLTDPVIVVLALIGLGGGLYRARRLLNNDACLREFTPIVRPHQ